MIPAVFSAAGITLVVGQQIPAEILQPKVTGTASQYRHCTVRHSYGEEATYYSIVSLTQKQECVYTSSDFRMRFAETPQNSTCSGLRLD